MSNEDIKLFKDEILKKIREVEMKLLKQLSNKSLEINLNYENFCEKVNSILESNKLMIDSITNQKLHIEKINKLEKYSKEIFERLTTNEIRVNNSLNEIKKMKYNYDKIINENLIIPAYIGPGSMYKSLGDFIINSIDEFKKFKEEKEKIRNANIEIKTKIEVMNKNLTNFVELNSSRCRAYTDSKEREYQLKLDDKFKQLDEKSIENNQHIFSKQIQFEEKLKEIDDKIVKITQNNKEKDVNPLMHDKFDEIKRKKEIDDKIIKIPHNNKEKDLNLLIHDKFEEIKRKEDEMNEKLQRAIKDVQELKLMKKELKEEMKNINLKIIDLNKNTKLNYINQNKINPETLNIIQKDNLNLYGNLFHNSDSNLINLTERQSDNKKNDYPNISNAFNPLVINKLGKKENNKIIKNEKKLIIFNYNYKQEEEPNKNIINPKNKESHNLTENTIIKSTSNIMNEKSHVYKIGNQKIDNYLISPRHINKRIKEKFCQKTVNNLKFSSNENINKNTSNHEIKDEYIDKKNIINFDFKGRNIGLENEKEKLLKTEVEYFKKSPRYFKKEELIRPFTNSHKAFQNILIQTNKIDNIENNFKIFKKEGINNNNQIEKNSNLIDLRSSKIEQGNTNAIDCNIVNLNLLNLPKNKKKNSLFNEYIEKSSERKNYTNRTKSINSVDSKIQIKITPVFGRTTYNFYNLKDTGKIINNGNLNE